MRLRTCVAPTGEFLYGIHRPQFAVDNYRESDSHANLGSLPNGAIHRNSANFPSGTLAEAAADPIFEVPNAFPFRGVTYIGKTWADARARHPESTVLPTAPEVSFSGGHPDPGAAAQAIDDLPRPLQLALAVTSTDPRDLCCLARQACRLCLDTQTGRPWGLGYEKGPDGRVKPIIADAPLFEAVANNPNLPDDYKAAMVLRPGAQGDSEIVGEWSRSGRSHHVFEYLRRNSYIPWGHYAANMADDAVRYRLRDISLEDMTGMRHLYYQRTFTRLAGLIGIAAPADRRRLTDDELERLRRTIVHRLKEGSPLDFDRTLWGWNYGFDYAPSGYRLHASHQQVHQQYALIPRQIPLAASAGCLPAFACGDLVGDFVDAYRRETGKGFFDCYQRAIEANRRMDGDGRRESSLMVFEDKRLLLFVPKAQTSQWELQLMPKTPVGNILEADAAMRRSLDRGIWMAVRTLDALGARLITSIEYAKPMVDGNADQRLLMAFLPKLPESPGAFSEAQLRWINGHYPEDFATACRKQAPRP